MEGLAKPSIGLRSTPLAEQSRGLLDHSPSILVAVGSASSALFSLEGEEMV